MPGARAWYRKARISRAVLSAGLLPAPARVLHPPRQVQTMRRPRAEFPGVSSLDHSVRAHREVARDCELERLRSFHIDHQLELSRLLNWQISGFRTFEDPIDVIGGSAVAIGNIDPIAEQCPGFCELPAPGNRRPASF